MSWASRRRGLIIGGTLIVGVAVVGGVAYSALNKAPTCFDKKQNQNEEGVDCGGSCQYLCTASLTAPSVRFAHPIHLSNGRTDVIAYIDNPNPRAAAKNVSFSLELLNARGGLIATSTGVIDLPPLGIIPIFIPGLSRNINVASAFVTINSQTVRWFAANGKQQLPRIADKRLTKGASPRLTATLVNDFPTALNDIKLVAAIFDAEGNVIAASQTLMPRLNSSQSLDAVFTWNEAFSADAARIDVIPVLPLRVQ